MQELPVRQGLLEHQALPELAVRQEQRVQQVVEPQEQRGQQDQVEQPGLPALMEQPELQELV